jgi:hypothetical protein
MIQPLLINSLIRYFYAGNDKTNINVAIAYGGLTCLAVLAFIILHHPYGYLVTRYGMQIRIATCGLVYRKVIFQKHSLLN